MKKLLSIAVVILLIAAHMPGIADTEHLKDGFVYRISADNTVEITDYVGREANLIIPRKLDGKPIVSIADSAFSGCTAPETIILGECIRSIGARAFYGCANLRAVELPGSLESLGADAFGECRALLSVRLKRENPAFESANGVLYDTRENTLLFYPMAKSAAEFIVRDGTECIADNAVFENRHLQSIFLPESLHSIGHRAFYGCTALSQVHLPESLAFIGEDAFFDCANAVIHAKEGSIAHSYAQENGHRVQSE